MPDSRYSFRMSGAVPVVTAPAEIDTASAGELQAILLEWCTDGHATVVVDMTGTRFCDSAGLRELARAHRRALDEGGGLRLVIPADGEVPRALTRTGLDCFIPHVTALEQALVPVLPGTGRPPRPGTTTTPAGPPSTAGRHDPVAGRRACEQCGAVFVPRREHARFCGAGCRAAWNREHMGDPAVQASALAWSVTAMSEATARLPAVKTWDMPQAFAAIGEAVWWITMVDATLVRHHLVIYEAAMAARTLTERRMIDETLAGLRFVRNRMDRDGGLGDVIETGRIGSASRRVTGWMWKGVPEPGPAGVQPGKQTWETARYRAYRACLAGRTIGETFRRTVPFLTLTGANAASAAPVSLDASR